MLQPREPNTCGRRAGASALLLAVVVALIAAGLPASALGATFSVNSSADAPDASPGDGTCATSAGGCTVRAAVQEANALPGGDAIDVPAGTYPVNQRIVIDDTVTLTGAGAGSTILTGADAHPLLRVESDDLLVCDDADDSVRRFGPGGGAEGTFVAPGAGGLRIPESLDEGPDDDVYASGLLSGVHRYDGVTGAFKALFVPLGSGGLLGPTDARFLPGGDLYVTNYQPSGAVLRYDATTGAFKGSVGAGTPAPNSVAFQGADVFVTASNSVLRFDAITGTAKGAFVPPFSGGLSTARDLEFYGGWLYVASEGTDAILRYSASTGAFQGAFVPSGAGGLDRPTALAFGPDGDLYVVSSGTQQVLRYDGASGAFKGVFVQGASGAIGRPGCLLWRSGVSPGPTVAISRLTLAHGRTQVAEGGAGLQVLAGATVSLTGARVLDNHSSIIGGGIQNAGWLTLQRTEVRGNELPAGGGGVTSVGGGIMNFGQLVVRRSTIADNFATRGGGIGNQGTADIRTSTISGNVAIGGGGGLRNTAGFDGSGGTVRLAFSTVTGNEANHPSPNGFSEPRRVGGGISNLAGGRLFMGDSIVAGNTDHRSAGDPDFSPDCSSPDPGAFTSQRDNVVGILSANCTLSDAAGGPRCSIGWERRPRRSTPGSDRSRPTGARPPPPRCLPAAPRSTWTAACPGTRSSPARRSTRRGHPGRWTATGTGSPVATPAPSRRARTTGTASPRRSRTPGRTAGTATTTACSTVSSETSPRCSTLPMRAT